MGGSNSMTLTTGGRLGIGEMNPSTPLHINGSVPEIRATSTSDSNTPTMQIGYSAGSGYFLRLGDAANNEDVMLRTYGDSVFMGGNIGIGNSSPAVTGKGIEIHNEGNDTTAAIRLAANNNTGTPGQKFNSEIRYNGAAGWYQIVHYGSGDSAGTERFRIDAGGDSYTNDGTISSISDIRVKKDVVDLVDGLESVNQLRPVTFKYNGFSSLAADDDEVKYGFIADEVQAVAPQYVKEHREEINGEMVDDFKSLSTGRMIPMMMNAIQELSAQVEALQAEINTLKNS